MKKLISFISFFFIAIFLFANEHISIVSDVEYEFHKHETYEVWYDVENHSPAYVIWDLTFEEANLSDAAKDNRKSGGFTKCGSSAKHSDYNKTGYDRGHMCPNNDRDWSKESSAETFRMCNICPQTPALNRGVWKDFEAYGHKLAKKHQLVTIACGPIYNNTLTNRIFIGSSKVRVPEAFFKIFVYNKNVECYIFCQNNTYRKVDLSQIEKFTNYKFSL